MSSCVQVYCRTCHRCICAICVLEEHRTHKTVSVQTERLNKQVDRKGGAPESGPAGQALTPLLSPETDGSDGAGDPQPHPGEGEPPGGPEEEAGGAPGPRRCRVQVCGPGHMSSCPIRHVPQNYAGRERGDVENLLDQLSAALDRVRTQVVGRMESQLDPLVSKGESLVNRLEVELRQLNEKRAELEVQASSQDHIRFLQVRSSRRRRPGSPEPPETSPSPCRVLKKPQLLWGRSSKWGRTRRTRCFPSISHWRR